MESVVASLPVGLILLMAIVVLAIGAAAGWLAARARFRRKIGRASLSNARQAAAFIDALPYPALVVDADANVIARNVAAAQMLDAIGHAGALPLALDAAIGRVVRSRSSESLEVSLPQYPARRLHASVSPAQIDSVTHALVLCVDPGTGSGRADVYQRLIGTLAHELRTPLTAIMGHVDILSSCRMDEEVLWRRSLGFVAGEVERLARLVEDLLSLARLDRLPLHIQAVNVRTAAEEALSALYDAAKRRGVTLVLHSPSDLPRAQADPDRLRQVFLNLVDNAIKYAPNSTVTTRLTPENQLVHIEVSDTGTGISAEDLPRIFEPLYRGRHTSSESPGTGLGLTIVRTILDQHHAPINVRSIPDRGTTFSFSLPVARNE